MENPNPNPKCSPRIEGVREANGGLKSDHFTNISNWRRICAGESAEGEGTEERGKATKIRIEFF